MEVKFNPTNKMMESKYFSFDFPIISPLISEELKTSLMTDTLYHHIIDDYNYIFSSRKGKVELTILYDEFKTIFIMDQTSLIKELDHVSALYDNSDSEVDGETDEETDNEDDEETDNEDY
jgi:hypothetical protein